MLTFDHKMESLYRDYYPEFLAQFLKSIYSIVFLSLISIMFISQDIDLQKFLIFSDSKDLITYIIMGICTGLIASICF